MRWLKNEGDFGQTGQPLLEIETKATLEVEAAEAGILLQITKQEGETVEALGCAVVGKPGEKLQQAKAEVAQAAAAPITASQAIIGAPGKF